MKMLKFLKADFKAYKKEIKPSVFNISFTFMASAAFRAVILYRLSHYFDKKNKVVAILFEKTMHITTITWIGRRANISSGFVIRHIGGIVIGGKTKIGKNCEIRQGVTFGGNLGKTKYNTTQPIVGDNVLIGAGAKILGPIKIGDNCIIGANAVVVSDIPENSVAGGIPAKVLREVREGENPLLKTKIK
ncbi:serine O-acetyltransferase [Brumimicrobium aurantiacum]|uniref:Serine acetyltransferase n=1 Tax=Brumimicrobium aurantiacum TaxID=1737063 RepID=A0A3E1EZ03_9FLAO|nr:serine O-acetyltransferase [Brumimicrobium aurantiacum]RFC54786.1 serine acetyltransferase [Brumimicrobium aurantiacum]